MLTNEVARRYAIGREDGRRYLLVCQDMFDYYRGDDDLGYYYVFCDREKEVAKELKGLQFAPASDGITDRCHAVIPIAAPAFDESLAVDPGDWLAQYRKKSRWFRRA